MAEIGLEALKDVFHPDDIEWRLQSAGEKNGRIWGMALAYITNRAIMQRLDDVVGPENWRNEFREGPEGGVLCGLSIRVDGVWVTKWDGAENTDIEAVKGGLSGSMKRAAVQWGIGRYLYRLKEGWIEADEDGPLKGKTKGKGGKYFKWFPPELPDWAVPVSVGGTAVTTHDRLLGVIQELGPKLTDSDTGVVGSFTVLLKEYTKENWSEIKDNLGLAWDVTRQIKTATASR